VKPKRSGITTDQETKWFTAESGFNGKMSYWKESQESNYKGGFVQQSSPQQEPTCSTRNSGTLQRGKGTYYSKTSIN